MNKFPKLFFALAISFGAIVSASCGGSMDKADSTTEKPDVVLENPNELVKITVSKNGYEPKTIGVKKGQSVKLAFTRTDEENCGDELVFPKLNIKKKLPVGETVLVEFAAEEAGEIGFTCGMDMLRGKILAQ